MPRGDGVFDALDVVIDETAKQVRRRLAFLRLEPAAPGYASFGRRAAAYLIDGALVAAVLAVAGVLSFADSAVTGALFAAAGHLLPLLYLAMSHYGTGQTIGKRVLAIRVIDEVYGRLSFAQALLRAFVAAGAPLVAAGTVLVLQHLSLPAWAVALATAAALVAGNAWAMVDCLSALRDGGRRTLHDRVAGTAVVEGSASLGTGVS